MTRRIGARQVLILYFLSGFTALVFEVVWSRQACLIFGNTTLASATVIAAYMTGLALGSYIFGRVADLKARYSLQIYAMLEGGVGLFALFFPFLIRILVPLYKTIYLNFYQDFLSISILRFLLSFLILMIPTTLMGGTFPILSRFLARNRETLGVDISRLYAVNLFGAMSGTFLSGFVMIGLFGLIASSVIAALANLGIFAYIMAISWKAGESGDVAPMPLGEDASDAPPVRKGIAWLIIAIMGVHGFSAFVIQICWLRVMALILGSSTYAFSAVLTTFLAGLGLGTYAVSFMAKRNVKIRLSGLGFMELAVGASVLIFIPVFEWIVYFLVLLFPAISSSVFFTFAAQFAFSISAMIVPTFLMGLVFPSAIYFLGRPRDLGRIIGTTYAVNTLGGVLGSFFAAFFFISHFGLNGSLRIASALSIAIGLIAIFVAGYKTPVFKRNAIGALAAASYSFVLLFYPWDKNMYSSGPFIYGAGFRDVAWMGKKTMQKVMSMGHELLFYKDGISSTVTVLQHDLRAKRYNLKAKSLRVNGKTDASTIGDMDTQLYLGYMPLFAHPDPRDVLVIGLGAGITLSAASDFTSVASVECVEIEPAVVMANSYFSSENNNVLSDPRVKLIIGDGRNHLEFTPRQYDVIISEPSNPWIAGISNLFTRENYEVALKRLKDDGIFCQWFHAYQMSQEDFRMVIRTFASVFPRVNLFRISAGDYILLGSRKEIVFDYARMRRLIDEKESLANHLRYFSRYGENFVVGCFKLSDRDVREALAGNRGPLNTDDRLSLEYNAPKYLYASTTPAISHWINSLPRRDTFPAFRNGTMREILARPGMWSAFLINGLEAMQDGDHESALFYLKEARQLNPSDPNTLFAAGKAFEMTKNYPQARKCYKTLGQKAGWGGRSRVLLQVVKIKEDIGKNPALWRSSELFNVLGNLEFTAGDNRGAESALLQAINIDPTYAKNYIDLAFFYFLTGEQNRGLLMLGKAKKFLNERSEFSRDDLLRVEAFWYELKKNMAIDDRIRRGQLYLQIKDYNRAKQMFTEVLNRYPRQYVAYAFLAQAEAGLGRLDKAKEYLNIANELRAQAVSSAQKSPPRKRLDKVYSLVYTS